MSYKDEFHSSKKSEDKTMSLRKYFFSVIIKSLSVILLFVLSLIYIRTSDTNKDKFKKVVYQNSISFAKVYGIYQKYLGDVIPFKNINNNSKKVSAEKFIYESVKKEGNGYVFNTENYYLMQSLTSGIIIRKEKSNKYNMLLTIQDKNGLNVTYGHLSDIKYDLYDYVKKGEILGNINSKVYIDFKIKDKYLSYEKYV